MLLIYGEQSVKVNIRHLIVILALVLGGAGLWWAPLRHRPESIVDDQERRIGPFRRRMSAGRTFGFAPSCLKRVARAGLLEFLKPHWAL